jgi:hypothetical protein
MLLPTRVNIINDSSERYKLKIDNNGDRKFDKIINIEPGGRLDGIEGSANFGYDVVVDIIINPEGPDNNIRWGGFKFNNPTVGYPNVRSDDFTTVYYSRDWLEDHVLRMSGHPEKRYWGKLNENLLETWRRFEENTKVLINSAPKPTFTIESFFIDSIARAKVWDLRINSYNFTL